MRSDCCFSPGDDRDNSVRVDFRDLDRPAADRENIIELGHKARQEVELFINGNIGDSTKGWPVRPRMPQRGIVDTGRAH